MRPARMDSPEWREKVYGPDEQLHVLGEELPEDMLCPNPKCGYKLSEEDFNHVEMDEGLFYCPQCHGNFQLFDPNDFSPGGGTISALSLRQVGDVGENVVRELGEIPGLGRIMEDMSHMGKSGPASANAGAPDFIVAGNDGVFYAVEVKSNDARAQERFKLGDAKERLRKTQWALERGYKPVLVGVRLNFYNDTAQVFVQPNGMMDTWYGSANMQHATTVSFEGHNPFKSPAKAEPQSWTMPTGDPFEAEPGQAFARTAATLTVPRAQDELRVRGLDGKPVATIKRCQNCGHTYWERERTLTECPTCGRSVSRREYVAKVVLAGPSVDQIARSLGWEFGWTTNRGERVYTWTDEFGHEHRIQVGSGAHGKGAKEVDAQRGRQRMKRCMEQKCHHGPSVVFGIEEGEPEKPLLVPGQQVMHGGKVWWITEVEGDLVAIYDEAGESDVVPAGELKTAMGYDPSTWKLPEGMEFKHRVQDGPPGADTWEPWQQVSAWSQGRLVGHISWAGDEINGVEVLPEFQRLGVASALLAEAERIEGRKLRHSDNLTDMGYGWAMADPEPARRPLDPVEPIGYQATGSDASASPSKAPRREDSDWTPHHLGSDEDDERTPESRFVYYRGLLKVEPWHHNQSYKDLLESMLQDEGYQDLSDEDDVVWDDVAAGLIFEDGEVQHEQLAPEDVQERAEEAIDDLRSPPDDWYADVPVVEWSQWTTSMSSDSTPSPKQ